MLPPRGRTMRFSSAAGCSPASPGQTSSRNTRSSSRQRGQRMEQAEEEAGAGAAVGVVQLEHAEMAVLDAHLRVADDAVAPELEAREGEVANDHAAVCLPAS